MSVVRSSVVVENGLEWSYLKIKSDSAALYSRWHSKLKYEYSLIGYYCFIIGKTELKC